MVFEDLDNGDETRRNGDYIGLAHGNSDGSALDSATPAIGVPVTYDGTAIAAAASGESVAGVLYDYDVYGDFQNQKISDQDATVKTRGAVKADVSGMVAAGITAGDTLGANGELYVLEVLETDGGNNEIAEVLVR